MLLVFHTGIVHQACIRQPRNVVHVMHGHCESPRSSPRQVDWTSNHDRHRHPEGDAYCLDTSVDIVSARPLRTRKCLADLRNTRTTCALGPLLFAWPYPDVPMRDIITRLSITNWCFGARVMCILFPASRASSHGCAEIDRNPRG
jgi:hypothetical protein